MKLLHTSPSGKYQVTWSQDPDCTSHGVVSCGDREIATVYRNYYDFPAWWAECHPNGHDYLITGSDYQGQTVIELDTGRVIDRVPRSASKGLGFCWVDAIPSPSKTMLLVVGCFWACPFEVWLLDFTDPLMLPLPVLRRMGQEFVRWEGETAIVLSFEGEEIPWDRPKYIDAAIHYYGDSCLSELKDGMDLEWIQDDVEMMHILLDRSDPQEREEWSRVVKWEELCRSYPVPHPPRWG